MLGLLNPGCVDLRYRSLYSRCCEFLRLEYGVSSLVFHSFESVFLFAVACDAGIVDLASVPNQFCCRLRAGRSLEFASDRELGRFCASFSLLAAETKSADAFARRAKSGCQSAASPFSLAVSPRPKLLFEAGSKLLLHLRWIYPRTFGARAQREQAITRDLLPSDRVCFRVHIWSHDQDPGRPAARRGTEANGFEHRNCDSRIRLRAGLATGSARRAV
jgi:hypothetical protein